MKLIIIVLIIVMANATDLKGTECTCIQLKYQSDCLLNALCEWNTSLSTCQTLTNTVTLPPQPQGVSYCSAFFESNCSQQKPCAWLNQTCTHFTGCSAYIAPTDGLCQSISTRCFKSDGQRCVEIGDCSSYTLESLCTHSEGKGTNSGFCFWNTTGSEPQCVDATECSQLPSTLKSDQECRKEISICRFKQGGGCETSPQDCSDHLNENQCFSNKDQTLKCFWDSNKCLTKNCDNAPLSYLTDEACKQFLSECTTKQGGGCTIRTKCPKATNQAACVEDLDGNQCYWNGLECLNLICNTAPLSMISNSDCEKFISGCITKEGGGCLQNRDCAVANIETACSKDIYGFECIWNGNCKDKTCDNAPSTLTTHEACQQYLTTCTVKPNGQGCQDKKCGNAPLSLTTTDQCEQYLPKSKCIANLIGGCIINTICEKIGLEQSCLKDDQDRDCFWNDGKCQLKSCQNAPASMNTHQLCQEYRVTCTVNETSNGCLEMTCPNLLSENICQNDLNGLPCKWMGGCYMKQCQFAPNSYNSHEQCHSYLSTCTVTPSLSGCQDIPQLCESLTIEANCKFNQAKQICGWTGTACMIKNCLTAPKTYNMNYECDSYISGCVVNNEAKGCMSLPTTCNGRGQLLNCEFESTPKCFWSQTNKQCVDRTCTTAPQGSDCTTYDATTACIKNATNTGCVEKPAICTGLAYSQCLPQAKIGGDCYWQTTSNSCVDLICSNLKPSTINHDNCYTLLNKCTVNISNNGCVEMSQKCSDYTVEYQCKFTKLNERCQWSVSSCVVSTCDDAPTTKLYNDHTKCTGWSNQCTVGLDIGDGCVERQSTCIGLKQSKCTKTNTLQRCMWNGASCVFLSSVTQCESLRMSVAYTNSSCSDLMNKCKVNNSGNGCIEKTCTEYSGSFTVENCQTWKSTCSMNKAKTGCIDMKSFCSGYSETDCYQATEGLCTWSSSCIQVTNSTPCSSIGLTTYSDSTCNQVLSKCTVNSSNTGCEEKSCSNYKGTFSKQNCNDWLSTCTVNRQQTTCINKESLCSSYTIDNCYQANEDMCNWTTSGCTPLGSSTCAQITAPNTATDYFCPQLKGECQLDMSGLICTYNENVCDLYTGPVFDYTTCQQWYKNCTANSTNTKCVNKTCSNFPYEQKYVDLSNCYTWGDYDIPCTINKSKSKCIPFEDSCDKYLQEDDCWHTILNESCYFENGICNKVVKNGCGTTLQLYNLTSCTYLALPIVCMANRDESGCIQRNTFISCTALGAELNCVSQSNRNCVWNGSSCVSLTDCSQINRPSGKTIDAFFCLQQSNSTCMLNRDGTACIPFVNCTEMNLPLYNKYSCGKTYRYFCIPNDSQTGCIQTNDCEDYYADDYSSQCQYFLKGCKVSSDGTRCVTNNDTCSSYSKQKNCNQAKEGICLWTNDSCVLLQLTQCNLIKNTFYNKEFCLSQTVATVGCSVERYQTSCLEPQLKDCESVTQEQHCSFVLNTGCNWDGSNCLTPANCEDYKPTSFTDEKCQRYDSTQLCHLNKSGTACFTATCADYSGKITAANCKSWSIYCSPNRLYTKCVNAPYQCSHGNGDNCTVSQSNVKCTWNGSCTNYDDYSDLPTISNQFCMDVHNYYNLPNLKCKVGVCTEYTGTVTLTNCSNFKSNCVSSRDSSACLQIQSSCSSYSETDCLKATEGMCNYTMSGCELITTSTPCAVLKPLTYTDATCSLLRSGCYANSGTTACEEKTCQTKPSGLNLTFQDCQDWLKTCSVNAAKTNCVDLKATCNQYSSATDCNQATEGECWQSPTGCIMKTCTSQTTLTTDDQCSTFLSKCTIGIQGLCVPRKACNLYTSQTQCFKNEQDKDCYWMAHISPQKCDDMVCSNFPLTSPYNSHSGCETALKTCTVAANGAGCTSKGECTIFTAQAQCITSITDEVCVWNNDISPKCQIKSCITASHSLTSHSDCYNYISTGLRCTLNSTAKGCQSLAACSTYTQVQCIMDVDGKACDWKDDKCEIKTCSTASADLNHNDHSKCNNYLNSCTVATSGLGCIPIPGQCSQMTIEEQCRTTLNSELCYWNTETTPPLCQIRTCSNAPSTANNATKCNAHLVGCTLDEIKCKSKNCEDISFTTDEQCKAALPQCTTNGTICKIRGQCSQATNQAGCVTDVSGKQCGWIAQSSSCALKSCETAPLAYTSEQECQSYISSCTANLGGGCTTKGTCQEAKVQAACTKGIDGTQCAWGEDGVCKAQDCSDLISPTHSGCFAQQSTCTTNGNGKCAKMTTCHLTKIEQACIMGTDGPCLWVDGACYLYDNCKSIQWNIDAQCKKISQNCTTNGFQCFPITDCSKTNTQGGCITGTDGKCAQKQLESIEQTVCLKFHSCSDLNYKTHQECNDINSSCTSDLEKTCISLLKCVEYTQQGNCYLSGEGIVKNDLNQITQTQYCIWDDTLTPMVCRNQKCTDLVGVTDKECKDQLSQCTSNGMSCILRSTCHEYKEESECQSGTDGVCLWNAETLKCRTKECFDYKNGSCSSIKDCIPNYDVDENTCTLKTTCSAYKSIQACHEGGSDGLCVWDSTDNQCFLMTSCPKANNDQIACQSMSSVCLWTDSSNGNDGTYQKSSCKPLQCSLLTIQNCRSFNNWDNTIMTSCIVKETTCKEVLPETLKSEQCYISSGNMYSWNQGSGKCEACNKQLDQVQNENIKNNRLLLALSMITMGLGLF